MGKDKKHKKKSKNKLKKSKHQSSDDSSSSEDKWVEEQPTKNILIKQKAESSVKTLNASNSEQDDWLSNPALFACVSRDEIRQNKEKNKEKKNDERYMLDRLGQTERELNPYWKDGGSGLPLEAPVASDSLRLASVSIGDQGAAWLRKALQRAREQAADERRPLEDVVAERWGSLEKLESMIAEAEKRDRKPSETYNRGSERKRPNDKLFGKKGREGSKDSSSYNRDKSPLRNKQKTHFAKPKESDEESSSDSDSRHRRKNRHNEKERDLVKRNDKNKSESLKKRFDKPRGSSSESFDDSHKKYDKSSKANLERKFTKPASSSDEDSRTKKNNRREKPRRDRRSRSSSSTSSSSSEKYRKRHTQSKRDYRKHAHDSDSTLSANRSTKSLNTNSRQYSSSRKGWRKSDIKENKDEDSRKPTDPQSSRAENVSKAESVHSCPVKEIAAPAEVKVLTDKEMNELAAKLVKAELLGNQELVNELKAKLEKARKTKASRPAEFGVREEVVILTHTDSKGFTRPVSLGGPAEPSGGRRKAKKVETHTGGKRMRYFADDDKYSLQEMFQREKLNTVEDSNEVFAKLASKGIGRDDSARDMEDVFEETARMEEAEGKSKARARQQAIEESKRTARCLESCQWCLESRHMLKHLIVTIGKTCYLCVPPYQSLTENHCLIVPSHHTPSATQLDEDVWAEMMDFRRKIVKMFLDQEEDVVFFESARHLNKFPHMLLNCVPVPKETGDLAPIYFKKAIQESEMEWSNNKKLVELKGRDVRKAVPRGLPYFAVDFGMDSGFAHVIEDEKLFPQNFAQEIIGGMMDLDHTIWRKQRKQTFEEQSKKVIQLTKMWALFDKEDQV